jgi:phosphatidylserine decarboxylase
MVLDGILYGVALLLLGGGAAWLGGILWALPLWALAAFVMYFFRDPERVIPSGNGVISPADGRVVDVRRIHLDGQQFWKISIFLNIFNVHVNRAPIGGVITQQSYTPGRFCIASRPEASVENEQNTVAILAPGDGPNSTVIFKQIAGAVARRIVFNKKVGDRVQRGERVGLIKFGSRVDLFIPPSYALSVATGDRVKGGLDWIAQPDPSRGGESVSRACSQSIEQFQST